MNNHGHQLHNYQSGLHWERYGAFAGAIPRYPRGYFDAVVVDGMARSLTAWLAVHWISPEGIVVFDNSDRQTYLPGYKALQDAGFSRIGFCWPCCLHGPVFEPFACPKLSNTALSDSPLGDVGAAS